MKARLIEDQRVADLLTDITVERCLVTAMRHAHQAGGAVCTSPYECCACAMPAMDLRRACEMCAGLNFRRARKRVP